MKRTSQNHAYRDGFNAAIIYVARALANTSMCPKWQCIDRCELCWMKAIRGAIKDYEETQHTD